MQSLKEIINGHLLKLSTALMILILGGALVLQALLLQDQCRENAQSTFGQIGQILAANQQELAQVEADYRETCLLNAESIAYMIQHNPEIIGDVEEFHRLAELIQADEIHVFQDGVVITGTHPQYYGYNFDMGEQIGFFKPMLEDKNLRLCQDITPNTAEGKLVQYSAVWSEDGQYIIQVGMYPEAVVEYTRKNELSYIFSLLQGVPGVKLYAISADTGTIMGAANGEDVGLNMTDIGLRMEDMGRYHYGMHVCVSGTDSYCVFTEMDDMLVGYVISRDQLYHQIPWLTGLMAMELVLIGSLLVVAVWRQIRRYIIESIQKINMTLRKVELGDLSERVDIQSSTEFSELGSHINDMMRSLLTSADKMSFVLNHTNMRIGMYEYNESCMSVFFTEHVPRILCWNAEKLARYSSDFHQLQAYLMQLRNDPVPGEENVFRFAGKREVYVRLEEMVHGSNVLGIIMDVTEEILTRRRIETERDIDLLTGLFNRFGLDHQLARIFEAPQEMGQGALIMIDSDELKFVNDAYGHAVGDEYLRRIAEIIGEFGTANRLAARQSGDEFVLLLYGYPDKASLEDDLRELGVLADTTALTLANGVEVPVRFSVGWVLTEGRTDYQAMLSEADGMMYAIKRERKQARQK